MQNLDSNIDATSQEFERVLAKLQELDERDLHQQIIWPLLERMGAQCIRYVHGSFERGKDFLYLAQSFFGGVTELWVCQVKNERLTGRSSKLSESTASFLFQAIQCKKTEVLHPTLNTKMTPDRVALITTFALPDAPLADGEQILSEVRSSCTIIGPEQVVSLLSLKWKDKFLELAYPGNAIGLATRQYLLTHREAVAFEARTTRSLNSFFVSIGLSAKHRLFQSLLNNTLHLPASGTFIASAVEWESISVRQSFLSSQYDMPVWVTAQKNGANFIVAPGTVLQLHDSVKKVIARLGENISEDTGKNVAASLLFVRLITELLESAQTVFQLSSEMEVGFNTDFSIFREILPIALTKVDGDICLTGTAGAGKTSLAKILTLAANENGINVLYFPCSQIKSEHQSLHDAMKQFLKSLSPKDDDLAITKMISDAEIIVLDGCDEATTFRSGLSEEIGEILVPDRAEIHLERSISKKLRMPTILAHVVRVSRNRLEMLQWPSLFEWEHWLHVNEDPACKEQIRVFRKELLTRKKKVVLTVRDELPLALPESVQVFAIRPFDDTQLFNFFKNWFNESESKRQEIFEFLNSHPYVKEICRTPINATIVAAAHERGFELPNSKFEIYHRRFELLLERWDRERGVKRSKEISSNDKMRFLGRIAYQIHIRKDHEFSRELAHSIWKDGFMRAYPSIAIEEVLEELEHVNCIIFGANGGRYTFGHLSFQEYLAALSIFHSQKVGKLISNYGNIWWRQVLIFYAGICGDLDRFVKGLQTNGGVREYGTLLEEMLCEARYTSPAIKDFVSHIRHSEYAIRSQSYGNTLEVQNGPDGCDRPDILASKVPTVHAPTEHAAHGRKVEDLKKWFESQFIDKGEYWEANFQLGSGDNAPIFQLVVYPDFASVQDEVELPAREHCETAHRIISRMSDILTDSIDNLLNFAAEDEELASFFDDQPNAGEIEIASISITDTSSFTVSLEVNGHYCEVAWDDAGVVKIDVA